MAIAPRTAPILLAMLALCLCLTDAQSQKASSLFAQAAQSTLDRDFPSESISYLLLDARSESVIAERWSNPEKPIPVGSLIKPFTAFAYAQTHREFPTVICSGQHDSCWRPHGHGRINIAEAIANSCNAYFLQLANGIPLERANVVLTSFGLPPVAAGNKSVTLAGLSSYWRVTPLSLARAYATFAREPHAHDPEIFAGLQGSASTGTARAVSVAFPERSVLAKTGTAQCAHTLQGPADGFAVILYPADDPRIVLLTRKHGVTGATTAATAAAMLRSLEAGQQ